MRARDASEQVASAMRLGRQYAIGTVATYGVTMTATTLQVACNAGCPAGAPSEPTATVLHEVTLVSGDDGIALTTPVLFSPLGVATAAREVFVRAVGVA